MGRRLLGFCALFSGAALLVHIVSSVSLPAALATSAGIVVVAVYARIRRASPDERAWSVRVVRVGVAAGAASTVVYDSTKAVLSYLDPSPFNPFDVIRIFGQLLAGPSAAPAVIYAAGTAFHLTNGVAFGVAYALLVPRPSLVSGIAWGLFLELCQLSLYPGWLNITFFREFAQISALSHVAYGATLGILCARATRNSSAGGSIDA